MKSYSYDAVSRLASLGEDLAGSGADLTQSFTYNPASQIATATRSNDSYAWSDHYNLTRNYGSNGLNQYLSSGPVTPTYDAKGNLTAAGGATYGYSSENLLTTASGGITLAYDPMLRLYQTAGGSAGTTRFAYEGADLIAEHNSSNAMLRRYVHGPGSDEPLVWYEGSGTSDRRFLHSDERGSVIATSNSSGTTLATNAYDEYGIPKSTNSGRFQYTGQTWLPELGMYHYKARIYSPTLGRFLQTDPIGYDDEVNLYSYVGNDPVNRVDPSGTTCINVGDGRFECKVDKIVFAKGQSKLSEAQTTKLRTFERRYSAAVTRMYANNRTVRVGTTGSRIGTSFNVNSRSIANGLASRTFIYRAGQSRGNALMDSGRNYHGSWTNVLEREMTRGVHQMQDIAHEGIHRSPAEQFGNPLGPVLGNSPYNLEHQAPYNRAAADMLREN